MNNTEKILAKVRALLALAEEGRGGSENERQQARAQAEKLMLRHSIDESTALMSDTEKAKPEKVRHEIIGAYKLDQAVLAHQVFTAFGCATIREYKNGAFRAYGFKHDLELATALFESLRVQMLTEMQRVVAYGYRESTVRARKSFASGFAGRVGYRLTEFYRTMLQEAEVEGTGNALVLADKSSLVQQFFEDENPDRSPGAKRKVSQRYFNAGVAAGSRADIALGSRKVQQGARAISA